MKNKIKVEVEVSTDRTLTIVGCHTRWDVGTKSRLVKEILGRSFPPNMTNEERYAEYAAEYGVTWQTIHNWVKFFGHICHVSQYALDGTLLISPTVVKGKKNIANTFLQLRKLHAQLEELRDSVEVSPYTGMSAKQARRNTQREAGDTAVESD